MDLQVETGLAIRSSWRMLLATSLLPLLLAPTTIVPAKVLAVAPTVNEFLIPTPASQPLYITAGPDGNLWFTESAGNKIGRLTPSGKVTEFSGLAPDSGLYHITTGPDGNLWFVEFKANKIGRISPSGHLSEFPIPTASSFPRGITAGPDGNLWFVEQSGNKLARITPSGNITEYPLPTPNSQPFGITAGPDGNIWYSGYGAVQIGRATTSGSLTELPLHLAGGSESITNGPDGNLWSNDLNVNKIARITPGGSLKEFGLPGARPAPYYITAGPDSNLWYTEHGSNKIGRMTTDGSATEFPIPSGNNALGISRGPDGNLWFTEPDGNRIGELTLSPAPNRRVIVFLQGVCSSIVAGVPSPLFVDLQTLLHSQYGYNKTDFLTYSYKGGAVDDNGVWHPKDYGESDPIQQDYQTTSWKALHDDLLVMYQQYWAKRGRNETFILVGHSLGGVVAFEEVVKSVSSANYQRGLLSTVITIDSPLHGVPPNEILVSTFGAPACALQGKATATLIGIYNNDDKRHGFATTNTLKSLVTRAKSQAVQVVTAGNTLDCLWAPEHCTALSLGNVNTQWIDSPDATVLRFSIPKPCLAPNKGCIGGTHEAVLHASEAPAALKAIAAAIGPQVQ